MAVVRVGGGTDSGLPTQADRQLKQRALETIGNGCSNGASLSRHAGGLRATSSFAPDGMVVKAWAFPRVRQGMAPLFHVKFRLPFRAYLRNIRVLAGDANEVKVAE